MGAMRTWTPEILDEMSRTGDPVAEATLEHAASADIRRINTVFRSFTADDASLPADAPPEFIAFVKATRTLPSDIDPERVARGAQVLLENATLCSVVLLLKSLPCGYAAPRLSNVLHMTHNLERRPYRRALGVLQMLVNISEPKAFRDGGTAVVTAQKLRLLHAGVRHVVRKHLPDFPFPVPVSQLDMTYTIMTFSVLVVDGLDALGVKLSDQDAQDFFHLWQMYGELQGIRREWMPRTLEEGRAFCDAYAREFRDAAENPDGVALTKADLKMMKQLIPWWLRLVGLGGAPKVYLLRLMGKEAAARVGIKPGLRRLWCEWLVLKFPVFWHRLWKTIAPEPDAHERISRFFFRSLIVQAWGHEVTYIVPLRLRDFRRLA
jgi:hypothetical protein